MENYMSQENNEKKIEKHFQKKYFVGQKIEIEIEKIVFGGEGLGRIDGFTIFVPMSVPGDKVEIEIISLKKSYGRGLITKIIQPSEDRVEDLSKITFEDFDGCDFGMLKYEKQLEYKDKMLKEVLEKVGEPGDGVEQLHSLSPLQQRFHNLLTKHKGATTRYGNCRAASADRQTPRACRTQLTRHTCPVTSRSHGPRPDPPQQDPRTGPVGSSRAVWARRSEAPR